jgi:hypothetical protein
MNADDMSEPIFRSFYRQGFSSKAMAACTISSTAGTFKKPVQNGHFWRQL